MKLDRVPILLDWRHTAQVKVGSLPKPVRQGLRVVDGEVVWKILTTGADPHPAAHIMLADLELAGAIAARFVFHRYSSIFDADGGR
jgi:hypothetical protein